MVAYRLSRTAEDDIVAILAWSQEEFGRVLHDSMDLRRHVENWLADPA